MDLILVLFSPDLFSIVYKNWAVWRLKFCTGERGGVNNPQSKLTQLFLVFETGTKEMYIHETFM